MLGSIIFLLIIQNIPILQPAIQDLQLPANSRFEASSSIRVNSSASLELNGFFITDTTRRGETLEVILYWGARRTIESNVLTRVHLIDANNNNIVTSTPPQIPAFYPTFYWATSGYLRDTHYIQVSDTTKLGTYLIAVELLDCTDTCTKTITFANISGSALNSPLILQDIDILAE